MSLSHPNIEGGQAMGPIIAAGGNFIAFISDAQTATAREHQMTV